MTPYYQKNNVTLYLGDCMEVMRELPDESVQCVVTSPPYDDLGPTTALFGTLKRRRKS